MVSARRNSKLSRRTLLKITSAVVLHGCVAAVIITADRKDHHTRIKTLCEHCLVGAVEGLLARYKLGVQFSDPRFNRVSIHQQTRRMILEVDGSAQPRQQVDPQDAVDTVAAGSADGREVYGQKPQILEVVATDSQIAHGYGLRAGLYGSAPRTDVGFGGVAMRK